MVRLNADLILRCPQYFNAVRERELDLRGNKIAVVENLGATEDQFDSLDLSDNELVKLEGFPLLKRLSTLLINNNRIARINANIGANLPNLKTLVLTGNRLGNLGDLDALATIKRLEVLSLLDNLVTKKPNYRLYLINKLPKLRLLDFRKVKPKERAEASKLFAVEEAEASAKKVSANTFVPGEGLEGASEAEKQETEERPKKAPTAEELTAIKAAIASAQTLEEVTRLESALRSGVLPNDVRLPDADEGSAPKDATRLEAPASNGHVEQHPEQPSSMDEG